MDAVFDQAAFQYDASFTNSKIGRTQRNNVWTYLDQNFDVSTHPNILELNCGTGEDACYLASKGHQIVASDVSNEILTTAKTKATNRGLTNQITFENIDLKDESSFISDQKFDLVLSNFGGLNCLNSKELDRVFSWITNIPSLKDIILVIMPTAPVIEYLYQIKTRNFNRINQRKKGQLVKVSDDSNVKTYYYDPIKIADRLKDFSTKSCKITGFMPSYAERFIHQYPVIWKCIQLVESVCYSRSLFAKRGDHYLLHLKRQNN